MSYYKVKSKTSPVVFVEKNPDLVYDSVERITGDEVLAIEASSWADLATNGDVYESELFVVEVIE